MNGSILRWLGVVGVFFLLAQSAALADTILLPRSGPLFEDTSPLNISYTRVGNSATGSLSIGKTGAYIDVTVDGLTHQVVRGNFNLTAVIDPVASDALSGTFNVQAKYPTGTLTLQPMWNSTKLLDFGFSSDFKELDFEFLQQGSSVLPGVSDGKLIGVLVHVGALSTTSPSWTSSFSSVGVTTKADETVGVPLPGALVGGVALMGLAALFRVRRRYA